MTLSGAAEALRRTSDSLRTPLSIVDPGSAAFGAHGPGRLGEVGADLARVWRHALATREAEAVAHAERLDKLAESARRAGGGYGEVDDDAGRRRPEAS